MQYSEWAKTMSSSKQVLQAQQVYTSLRQNVNQTQADKAVPAIALENPPALVCVHHVALHCMQGTELLGIGVITSCVQRNLRAQHQRSQQQHNEDVSTTHPRSTNFQANHCSWCTGHQLNWARLTQNHWYNLSSNARTHPKTVVPSAPGCVATYQ
jgi:predicted nucleic acid binding AN1-type Zn finger protein